MAHNPTKREPDGEDGGYDVKDEVFHSAYRKWTRPETLSFLECYSQRRGQISESQDEATVFQYILDDMKDQGVWKKAATILDLQNKLHSMRDEYQKWISSDGAYSLPKHFRPYIAQMKDIFRNREQSNSFFDDSFDKEMNEPSSEQNELRKNDNDNTDDAERQTRRSWSRQETLALLECYAKRRTEIDTSFKKLHVYEKILEDMQHMNVLTKPLNAAHITSKIKIMKRTYKCAIESKMRIIPNCVRPFMKAMEKICAKRNSKTTKLKEESSECSPQNDFIMDGSSSTQLETLSYNDVAINLSDDNEEYIEEKERMTRRVWSARETRTLLQCYANRRKEIDSASRKYKIFEKILEDMKHQNVLAQPLNVINIVSKVKTMKRSYAYALKSDMTEIPKCVRPYMNELDNIFNNIEIDNDETGDGYTTTTDLTVEVESSDDEITFSAQEISTMDDPAQSTEIRVTIPIKKPNYSTINRGEKSILHRRTWTNTETKKLLECYTKRLNEIKTNKKRVPVYERIIEDMQRMNVLTKPLTPINIASKMKGMKKAYFRSIGSNILEIPNCVRPFLNEMNKICGEVNPSVSYAEPLDEELSDCEKDGDSTRTNDCSATGLLDTKPKPPRRWVTSEIQELLKCLLRHKFEYLRTFDKMTVCKRILKDLIIKRALKKPTTSSMISQKIYELRNGFLAVRYGGQEPTDYVKLFMKQLQQIFGLRSGRRNASNSAVKPNSVKGPEQPEQIFPMENVCSTSESPLIKLEFIKLESVPSTTICGEIHRCSETQLLSFVCTICREPFTDLTKYSTHLIYHFGVVSMATESTVNELDLASDDKNTKPTITELPEDEMPPDLQQMNFRDIMSEPSTDILPEKSSSLVSHSLKSLNDQPETKVNISPARKSAHNDTNVSSKTITNMKALKKNIVPASRILPAAVIPPKDPVNFKCCKICRQDFDTLDEYERHIKAEYEENNMLICPYVSRGKQNKRCQRKTRYTSYCMLSRHLRVGHGQYAQRFKCEICNKAFKSPKGLEYHLPMHTGNWRYQCDICKKSFSLLSYLEIHMRFHTGEKPELCTKCGRGFSTKSGLALHMRRHNGDLKRHPCTVCGQGFKFPNELLDHMRVHTGDKPYACTLCAKPYRSKKLVRQHELMHNPEKKHACRFCDLMFKQSSNRNLHERQKHKIA